MATVAKFQDMNKKAAGGARQKTASRSKKAVAQVLVASAHKREASIASIDAVVNKIHAAFTKKGARFSVAKVRQLIKSMDVMQASIRKASTTANAHMRVALHRTMPTTKLANQIENLSALSTKLALLQTTAKASLAEDLNEDDLLQVDENGYLVDNTEDATDELPEGTVTGDEVDPLAEEVPVEDPTLAEGEDDIDPNAVPAEEVPVEDQPVAAKATKKAAKPATKKAAAPAAAPAAQVAEGEEDEIPEDGIVDETDIDPELTDPTAAEDDGDDELLQQLQGEGDELGLELPDSGIDDVVADEILDDGIPTDEDEAEQPVVSSAKAKLLRSAGRKNNTASDESATLKSLMAELMA